MVATTRTIRMGKTRDVNHPYIVFFDGDWQYRVLKGYQTAEKEASNQFARWFCAVKSPYTLGSYDIGDTYISDIPTDSERMECICDDPKNPNIECPMNILEKW